MKIHVTLRKTLSGVTTEFPRVDIDQGEPLSIPLQSSDGTPWDTTGATVVVYPKGSRTAVAPNPCTITGGAVQVTALASAGLTPGVYRVQIWKNVGDLATDGDGEFALHVH